MAVQKSYKLSKQQILSYLQVIKNELNKNGIKKIGLFGSFAKDSADLFSDVDIVIKTGDDFVKKHRGIEGFLYFDRLKKILEREFGRRVDICDESGLKDKSIIKEVIYA